MKQPDMRRVGGAHSSRWPLVEAIVRSAEPLGAAMGEIRKGSGLECHKTAAYVNHYCKAGYLFSAGPRGGKRYYLSREKADAAADLRAANPVILLERKVPKLRGSVMSGVLSMMAEAGPSGVTTSAIASALGVDPGQVRQSISDLRRLHGKVFSAGIGSKRRHFASQEFADDYLVALSESEVIECQAVEAMRLHAKESRKVETAEKRQQKRDEVLRTRGDVLAKILWARRQVALELREQRRAEKEAAREAKKAAELAAKQAKAAKEYAAVKTDSVRKVAPKPVVPVEVITPAHVQVQRLEPKGFGRYHVDEKSVPSIFGNLTPGSYLPLPSRVGR